MVSWLNKRQISSNIGFGILISIQLLIKRVQLEAPPHAFDSLDSFRVLLVSQVPSISLLT